MLKFNLKSCFFNPRKFNFLLLLKKSSRGKVIFQGEIQPRIVWMLFQASFGNVYSAAIPKGKLPLAKQENQAKEMSFRNSARNGENPEQSIHSFFRIFCSLLIFSTKIWIFCCFFILKISVEERENILEKIPQNLSFILISFSMAATAFAYWESPAHRILTLNTSTKTTLSPDQDSIRMFF